VEEAPGPPSSRLVVRIWLPDRPGALGLVASRIGALGGDIVGIDVLERGERVAVDEFAVVIPNAELVRLLVREIEEVDGASVEEWRFVERFPDPRLDALTSVERLLQATTLAELATSLAESTCTEFTAHWAGVVAGAEVLATAGDDPPGEAVLAALAAGIAASPLVASGELGPDDLAVAALPATEAVLMVGRTGHPFRRRERRQLLALARIAGQFAETLATD